MRPTGGGPLPRATHRVKTHAEHLADVAQAVRLEDDLLSHVTDLATWAGWTWHHETDSRKTRAGFPDLVLVHPRKRRVLWVELKSATGRLRTEQRHWRDVLTAAGEDYRLWRPTDWTDGTIREELTR